MRAFRFVLPILVVAALLALAPLVYFGGQARAQQDGKLSVVTSTTVFVDMIRRVGGDNVEVFGLVPAGADIHTFQPAPQDVQRASKARVAVWNGLGLDETAENTVASLNIADVTTVTLSEGIEPLDSGEEEEEGHEHEAGNPHMWLDPTLGIRYVGQIRDALIAADPANAATYQANSEQYVAELTELDAWAEREIATIPASRRKLVTFHDAFPYLAQRYGLEVIGVVLKSPGREPSAQEVATLVSQIKELEIPAVYTEPQFNAQILTLAARDANVQVKTLYSDALDDTVTSYTDVIKVNVTSLTDGLR